MRFQTFEFQQYAGFEKRSLKFDDTKRLHIIMGDNEAGKSRLLRAFGRFFFGFPQRGDPDQFGVIGSKSKLLASIKLDGQVGLFERNRSKTEPFIALGGHLSADSLLSELGGLNEKQFLNLHALSHDELRQGGVDLMGGKGSLGKSLFAAGAGLIPIQKKIADYRKVADDLFLPRANAKKVINQLLLARTELQAKLKDSEFNQQKFAELSGKISVATKRENDTAEDLALQRSILSRVSKATELRAELDVKARELVELEAENADKTNELEALSKSLQLGEAWLQNISPSFLPVILSKANNLSEVSRELEVAQSSIGIKPTSAENLFQLDVAELSDLPDVEYQQNQIEKLEGQASEFRAKVSLIADQLDLPDAETSEFPLPQDMRDLQDKMRDLIQEKRNLDKAGEALEAELRELTNRQKRLKQSAPEIDADHFEKQIKLRDGSLRDAINLLAEKNSVKAVAKITEAQTLIDALDKMTEQRLLKADDVAQIAHLNQNIEVAQAKQNTLMEELASCFDRKSAVDGLWRDRWVDVGLPEVSMRSYAEWQRLADEFLKLKQQLRDIDLELVEQQSSLSVSEARVTNLFEKWQRALGVAVEKLSPSEKRRQLNAWTTEVQSQQAKLRTYKALSERAERANQNQKRALEALNSEFKSAGIDPQMSPATALQFVNQLEILLKLKFSCDDLFLKIEGRRQIVQDSTKKLEAIGLEDLGNAEELQAVADAAKDEHSQAARELAELSDEMEQNWRSNDPLILESQIKVLEEKIMQKVQVYKLNKAAAHVLDAGLERFVKQQGQDLLSRASEHMQALTNSRYREIRVDGVDDESHWSLIDEQGEEVPSMGLSDGTRDQLFFAMRLSFLSKSKLPFIADDLFINFDDQRSGAAFARLETALPDSQLFYFTHHRHLADVAISALGAQNVEILALA